eukprot:scaffold14375_cov133-Isochrysis_galbana.AAC.1
MFPGIVSLSQHMSARHFTHWEQDPYHRHRPPSVMHWPMPWANFTKFTASRPMPRAIAPVLAFVAVGMSHCVLAQDRLCASHAATARAQNSQQMRKCRKEVLASPSHKALEVALDKK